MTETIERFSLKDEVSKQSQYLEVSKNEISVKQETIQKMLGGDGIDKKNDDASRQQNQTNNNNQRVPTFIYFTFILNV